MHSLWHGVVSWGRCLNCDITVSFLFCGGVETSGPRGRPTGSGGNGFNNPGLEIECVLVASY